MTTTSPATRTGTGWFNTRDIHDGRYDHHRQPACRNFVSDAEHAARLLAEAHEHDRELTHRNPSGATTREAAYVDEFRPS